jgi:hypothetical protein
MAELGSELAALRSRRERLSSVVASTPKPAASQKVLKRLQQASEQLQLLQSLQVRKKRGSAGGHKHMGLTLQSRYDSMILVAAAEPAGERLP